LPNIRGLFSKEIKNNQGTYQIFRLLDNVHYSHIAKLVELIEKLLNNKEYKKYIRNILKEENRITFGDKINELLLLNFLDMNKFKIETLDTKDAPKKKPEFKVQKNNNTYLIELWTFHELYGFKVYNDLLLQGLKYIDSHFGYEATISINLNYAIGNLSEFYYQNDFRDRFKDQRVLNQSLNRFLHRIKRSIENGQIRFSTQIAKQVKITVNFSNVTTNKDARVISFIQPTTSFSTVDYFRDPADYNNEFYKKLKDKLNQRQLGLKEEGTTRVFMANFSDTTEGRSLVRGTLPPCHNKNFTKGLSSWSDQNCFNFTDVLVPVDAALDFYLGEITYSSSQKTRNNFEKDFSYNLQQ
jgi:hypothetical protein